MILLDATTRKLQIVLASAKTSNDSPWVASYVDISQSTFGMTAAASATGASNGVTAVDVVAAPGATTTRQLKYFSLLNADTVAITATVRYNDNATLRNMVTFIIPVGASLVYNAESGWIVQSYAAGQILGTATNDSAAAGNVGQLITNTVAQSLTTGVTSSTRFDVCSISLTPGDWDVDGAVGSNGAASTVVTTQVGWINTVSATIPAVPGNGGVTSITGLNSNGMTLPVNPVQMLLAATTTVYLGGLFLFTTSTCGMFGVIRARRKR